MIIRPAPSEHYPWLLERAGILLTPHFGAIEAVDAHGEIQGMVGFDGITEGAINMHIALEKPIALRSLLRPAFGIAFDDPPNGYGKLTAIALVKSSNQKSIALVGTAGFIFSGRVPDVFGDHEDLMIFSMRRAACRYRWPAKEAA
jgi:hypothetical protein